MKNAPKKFHETPDPNSLTASYDETLKAAGDMYTKYIHRIANKERNTDIKYETEKDHKHFDDIEIDVEEEASLRKL